MKKQAEINWPLVAKLFAGGALTGAGVGAATSFMRHLDVLRQQAADHSGDDDNVLYLNLPAKPVNGQPKARRNLALTKSASSTTFAAGGLAAGLGTILAYKFVRDAYQNARKKQLQKEIDQAQNIYVGGLGQQAQMAKGASANDKFGLVSGGIGSAYLALLLAGLGGGVITNKLLSKNFKPIVSPNRGKPRKIVLRTQDTQGGGEDTTLDTDKPVSPDALEGIVRTDLAAPKVAHAEGGLADLIGAIASGRRQEFTKLAMAAGIEAAFAVIKGARFTKASAVNQQLAITLACTDPFLAPVVAPLAAAEFVEAYPGIYKQACHVEPRFHEHLQGLMEATVPEIRKAVYAPILKYAQSQVKEAATTAWMVGSGLADLYNLNVARNLADMTDKGEDTENTPGNHNTPVGQESPDMENTSAKQEQVVNPAIEISDDNAKAFWDKYGPVIDNTVKRV